ncbi:serine/arginine repetitive matrix protein 2 [Oreochromis niloticus]|uniref:serine/arginine repetitive matrix protein 2 n=1 Tax=Oreochromis niloticus TaxID=8128 RepID=UPI000DF47C4F|nr:serine/arginine repetitive matrix protein 2-like [Oreochromis niloticus]
MSHPLYNLYASGKQSSAQGRYGQPSMQAERDSHKASPHLGPGSSFSSSGVSSATPAKSGGTIPSRLTMPMSCRPEGSKTSMEEDIKRSKPVGSAESTSETAVNILMQFGLEKEDLEHPISYSEDQITPDNLPFTLEVTRNIPVLAQMQDYTATSPRVFPHTCSLCNKECNQMKDWVSHQNTSRHIENCKLLRKQYPEWNGEIASPLGASGAKPSPSTSAETSQKKTRHESRSHSCSPRSHRDSERSSDRRSRRSRSRSHRDSERRRNRRSSRSRSRSPRRRRDLEHRRNSHSCSQSRSPRRERHRSQSRSLYRSRQNRRSRSHSDSSWYDRPSSSRYRSRSRCRERRSSPRRRDEKRSSPRRSWERRSSTERSSPRRKKSSSSKILAKKLLETSALQSLSKQSDLETVVKTLAPALLAQLVKMKSSPSTSSSSSSRSASPETTKGTPSTEKTKAGKSSSPTMVRLQGTEAAVAPKNTAKATEAIEPIKGAAVDDSVTAEKISKDQPVAVTHPTFGSGYKSCLKTVKLPNSKLVLLDYKVLLISNLPEYHDGCYAEEDIAGLLTRHRFEYYDDTIYVIPQARMAFALMPTAVAAKNIVLASEKHDFILNGSKLRLQVEKGNILMTPKAQSQGSTFSTIMLTGLPEGNYRQEDVTKLVWRYFPDQTVQTLYYNIIVLSLQRRAFVFLTAGMRAAISPEITSKIQLLLESGRSESTLFYKTCFLVQVRYENGAIGGC